MDRLANLFLACILAGFALVNMPTISFLAGLSSFFHIVGALAILVFSFVLLYQGVKSLFSKL
ncbi:hypothetical protein ACSU6B_01825 [Neobacillus sp. C211]|uniref:hypothetical protein n=1 Tax=unclassified Neobacillus TaxID=2675272 RepID=UPI00397D828E